MMTLSKQQQYAVPLLLVCLIQRSSAQIGISLRGNRPHDIMSIQMTPTSPQESLTVNLRCFETTEELREAVKAYRAYNQIDTTLASTYGWPINNWCVSNIQDFSDLFQRKTDFNEPLDNWDLSSATSLSGMFQNSFQFNQDIGTWDVSQVQDFSRMFAAATVFDSDIRAWNTTKATDMSYMFMHAHAFHHNLFEAWDVSHVKVMEGMFDDSRAMAEGAYEPSVTWTFLKLQQGTPTIKLTAKEQRCGNNLRLCQE